MTEPYYADDQITLWHGDALATLRGLPDESVNCCVTSPPYYGLRDYGELGQYGLEPTPAAYVQTMAAVFAEVRRVLAEDGTLWLNIGDSYAAGPGQGNQGPTSTLEGGNRPSFRRDGAMVAAPRRTAVGLPAKNLLGIPWRVAFALQDGGWILRNAAIWDKPNAMPESAKDRLSTTYEFVFLLTKASRYWFDQALIREPTTGGSHGHRPDFNARWADRIREANQGVSGAPSRTLGTAGDTRAPGDVWRIPVAPFPGAHFAVFPPALAERCIVSGCRPGGTVLDPFAGSGTTGMVALKHGRRFVGIDLSAKYLDLALRTRLAQSALIEPIGEAS